MNRKKVQCKDNLLVMKLNILIFVSFIICSSCSKDDPKIDECLNGGVVDNCFKIDESYCTDFNGYVPSILKNTNNEIILLNSIENSLIAFDENLELVWHKTYNLDLRDIIQGELGEILILSDDDNISEVAELEDEGNNAWKLIIENDSIPHISSVVRTKERDGFIVTGNIESVNDAGSLVVSKINENGAIQWYTVVNVDFPLRRIHDVLRVQDKYWIFYSSAEQTQDGHAFYLLVVDGSGNITEKKIIGNIFNYSNSLSTPNDGLLIVSSSLNKPTNDANSFEYDYQLIKADAEGEIRWTKLYGGTLREAPYGIIPSKNGGYYLCGSTASYGFGNFDILLLRLDEEGNVLWQNVYGTSERDFGGTIVQLDNSDLVIAGTIGEEYSNKIFLMKLDENGTPK